MTNPDKPTIGDLTARLEFRYENDPLDFLKTGKGVVVVEDKIANIPLPQGPKGDKGDTGRLSEGDVRYFNRRTDEAEAAAEASEESAGRSKASEEAAKTSEANAKSSEAKAKTSETNAAKSETNAKTSETNAKSSETEASESASDAHTYRQGALTYREGSKEHREAAEAAKSDAESARDAAEGYRDGAKAHREAAKVSEDNAGTSADSANTSANAATAKVSEVEARAQQALDAVASVENIEDGLRKLMDDTEAWQNVHSALEQVDSRVAAGMEQVKEDILGGVGPAFDTLLELAEAFGDNRDAIVEITDQLAKKAEKGHTHKSADITDATAVLHANYPDRIVKTRDDGQIYVYTNTVTKGHSVANKEYVDDQVGKKADTNHTHTIKDTSGLQTALDGKAPAKHIHSVSEVDGLEAKLDKKSDTDYVDGAAGEVLHRSQLSFTLEYKTTTNNASYATPQNRPTALRGTNAWQTSLPMGTWRLHLRGGDDYRWRVMLNGGRTRYKEIGEVEQVVEYEVDTEGNHILLGLNSDVPEGEKFYIDYFQVDPGKADTEHTHTSADITDTTSWSGGGAYAGRVLRLNEHGKVGVFPAPSAGDDLTNKRYVDGQVGKKADTNHTHTIKDTSGLQTALDGKAPAKHLHSIADVDGLNAALGAASKAATWGDLLNKPSTFPPGSHTHPLDQVDGLADELDRKADQEYVDAAISPRGLHGTLIVDPIVLDAAGVTIMFPRPATGEVTIRVDYSSLVTGNLALIGFMFRGPDGEKALDGMSGLTYSTSIGEPYRYIRVEEGARTVWSHTVTPDEGWTLDGIILRSWAGSAGNGSGNITIHAFAADDGSDPLVATRDFYGGIAVPEIPVSPASATSRKWVVEQIEDHEHELSDLPSSSLDNPDTLIQRNHEGLSIVADPKYGGNIANKGYVDTELSRKADSEALGYVTAALGGLSFVVVTELPSNPDMDTVYLVVEEGA